MFKITCIGIFILCVGSVYSQTEKIQGLIKADSLTGYAINIVNYTKKIGTTNDDKGHFTIPSSVGDSIIFSSVQYEIVTLKVTQEHLENPNLEIRLKSVVQQLDLIRLSNVELSGNLNKDTKNIEVQPFVSNRTLGLPFRDRPQPTQAERRLHTATSSAGGIVALDPILNMISGRLKKLKRIKAIEDQKKTVTQGEKAFEQSFFIEHLGVPEDLITDFLYYCSEERGYEDLINTSNKLPLLEFLEKKAKDYKKHKEID